MSIEVNSTMTVRKTLAVAQIIPQYRHTEGQGRRRLLTPDEVLRLPNDEMLCVIRGSNILKLKKFDYSRHPLYAQIRKTSVQDYLPSVIAESEPEEVPENQKEKSKKKLYSSAHPPGNF